MKVLNETFTDDEFEKLKKAKGKKSWHDFIYSLAKNKDVKEDKKDVFDIDKETELW